MLWRSRAFTRLQSAPQGLLSEFSASYGEDVLDAARQGASADAQALLALDLAGSPAGPA